MSKRRLLEQHLRTLRDIREIMAALKSMSFLELRKLQRFLPAQRRVVDNLEAAAADFLYHYPQPGADAGQTPGPYLLLGSERGFCGDFNESLLRAFAAEAGPEGQRLIIAVGTKLCVKLESDPRVHAALQGASAAEEVHAVLTRVVDAVTALPAPQPAFSVSSLTVIHHEAADNGARIRVQQPFQSLLTAKSPYPYPPLLYLEPPVFFRELVHHYLFASLHHAFYSSLAAEQQRRLQHLEGAMRRIDQRCADWARQRNALRQEEITEEIELIILSAGAYTEQGQAGQNHIPR